MYLPTRDPLEPVLAPKFAPSSQLRWEVSLVEWPLETKIISTRRTFEKALFRAFVLLPSCCFVFRGIVAGAPCRLKGRVGFPESSLPPQGRASFQTSPHRSHTPQRGTPRRPPRLSFFQSNPTLQRGPVFLLGSEHGPFFEACGFPSPPLTVVSE